MCCRPPTCWELPKLLCGAQAGQEAIIPLGREHDLDHLRWLQAVGMLLVPPDLPRGKQKDRCQRSQQYCIAILSNLPPMNVPAS